MRLVISLRIQWMSSQLKAATCPQNVQPQHSYKSPQLQRNMTWISKTVTVTGLVLLAHA
jgi:hypothetical protein